MNVERYEIEAESTLVIFLTYTIIKTEHLNKTKIPVVRIVKSLKKYRDKILFPEKLVKANNMLEKVKLPEKKHVR